MLRTRATGTIEVRAHGSYVHGASECEGAPTIGARIEMHATFLVEVHDDAIPRVGGVERCGGDEVAPFAASVGEVTVALELLDGSGRPVSFDNVSPLVPFDVRVQSDVSVTAEQNRLRLARAPGAVRLRAVHGSDAWSWRWAVEPSEVTDVTVRFYVPGSAGTPAEVTDGARIVGSHRKFGGVFFQLRDGMVGGARLCDAPDARWVRLVSETPDVCEVVEVDSQSCDGCAGPSFGHEAARLVRDGICTVRAEAAQLDGGRGITRRVSAEFVGIENFAELVLAEPR